MIKLPSYSKYGNKKIILDNITFASKKEGKRYQELKLLERAHKITSLKLQEKFTLQEGFVDRTGKKQREICYIADFTYQEEIEKGIWQIVVEDVKSSPTFTTEVYKLKKRMFLYRYPHLLFREIF